MVEEKDGKYKSELSLEEIGRSLEKVRTGWEGVKSRAKLLVLDEREHKIVEEVDREIQRTVKRYECAKREEEFHRGIKDLAKLAESALEAMRFVKNHKELKDAMFDGSWDKAIKAYNKMKEQCPSRIIHSVCDSYHPGDRTCSERLDFYFFLGLFRTTQCPFYRNGECKIEGDIANFIYCPKSGNDDPQTTSAHNHNTQRYGVVFGNKIIRWTDLKKNNR